MAEDASNPFDWFCGVNRTEDTFYPFSWNKTLTIYNPCFTDFVAACVHAAFILLASLVLIFVRCCNARTTSKRNYLIRYPGHVFRWLVYVTYLLVCLCKVGEGVLSDVQTMYGEPTIPRLYATPSAAFFAAIIACVYYHHMEYWNVPSMEIPQFLYWFMLLAAECARFVYFWHEVDDFNILRWDLNIVSMALIALICLAELHLLRVKIFKCCTSKGAFPDDLKDPDMHYYDGYTNLPSSVLFWWLNGLFYKGYKHALEIEDMGSLNETHSVNYNSKRFQRALEEEQVKHRATGKDINLYWVYLKAFYPGLIRGGVIKFLGDTSSFLSPYLISGAIAYATALSYPPEEGTSPKSDVPYVTWRTFFQNGFVLVVVLFIQSIFQRLCNQHHYHNVIMESAHTRASLQAAVYDKSLRLSSYSISGGSMTMGQITNHMSVDATNILNSVQWVHYVWSIPYVVIGYLVILYTQLGYAALIGSTIFVLSIPIQTLIAKKQAVYQKGAMQFADSRLKQTNEMLQGIKLIKLYAWEDIFMNAIGGARGDEISQLITQNIWRIILNAVTQAAPLLVMLTSYSLYTVLTGEALTPDITFAALSVFNQISLPLFLLPMIFTFHVNAVVSTRRLSAFFTAHEVEDKDDGRKKGDDDDHDVDGSMQNGLSDSTVEINVPDAKVVTPGAKRSGKKKKKSGDNDPYSDTRGLLAESEEDYSAGGGTSPTHVSTQSSHSPIPRAYRVRENVLPSDVVLRVVDGGFSWDNKSSTPILSDIQLEINAGQLTMIVGQVGSGKSSLLSAVLGEMTTLHGEVRWNREQSSIAYAAQKAWLINASLKENILFGTPMDHTRYRNVIKACCLQPDIDILPGGDETEIGEKGINLSGGQKQRVSVARAMYSSKEIVILDDPLSALDVHVGSDMFYKGIMEFLIENSRTVILVTHQVQYLEHADQVIYMKDGLIGHKGTMKDIGAKDPDLMSIWNVTIKEITESEPETEDETKTAEERKKLVRQVSQTDQVKIKEAQGGKGPGKIIEKEERMLGSVSLKYYWYYLTVFGTAFFIFIVVLAMAQAAAQAGTNFYLAEWSDAGANQTNMTTERAQEILNKYLGGYAGLNASNIVLGLVWTTMLLIGALYTARTMHNHMLERIIHAPLRFFDTTPVGRVLNRFSADIQVLDQRMGQLFTQSVKFSLAAISGIIVNAIISWYFVVAITPVAIFYILLMRIFIASSRELQRLESISRSPIFAYFSETLGGLPTIRAYSLDKRFNRNIMKKIETNNTAFIYLQTGNRWLGVRLDTIGSLVVFVAGMSSLIASSIDPINFSPSYVGLAITYAMSISGILNWVIRCAADMEMAMNAVERINFYSEIDVEHYDGSVIPVNSWPEQGHVVYDNISARYAADLDPVLKKLTVHFKAGEKIGICGRTGSGKSSLTLALFRIIDVFQGEIVIDGINITTLPLKELRKRIAIIPQDPVLFTGTIRFNLDPLTESSDEEIWQSLEISQLKTVVTELNLGLDSMISEGGENFSVGQRQLFCLARAFLRKTKILVMDEATASIDFETDRILQEVVATAFQERTVLTIAHRVSTIMDSDRILVLSEGHIEEYGTPESLLAKENGIFASLVQSGK